MPGTSKKIAPYKQRKICLSFALLLRLFCFVAFLFIPICVAFPFYFSLLILEAF